ncbi:MAG TPA: hypothetical protein VLK85_21895 [Ramlibacter sp.]|nr:hypothetical protein [Ramlibacter sp.]
MSDHQANLLEAIARRQPLETFTLESAPAYFETHQGQRTAGTASVLVSRASIAIRFDAPNGLDVPKAGYGESNGKIVSADGQWSAPNVNDAGAASDGQRLFDTMALVVGRDDAREVAATRLVMAGAAWQGMGVLDGRRVIVRPLSRDVTSHHDERMGLTIAGGLDDAGIQTLGRATSFVCGLDAEILRVESYAADGTLLRARYLRGFRRVGRGPHCPFVGVSDDDRMRALVAVATAIPRLLKEGLPIDMVLDQMSAHNQVSQIHLGAPFMLLPTLTIAYHRMHGDVLDGGAASRREELARLNRELKLELNADALERFENLRVEILEAGYFHAPGYETGRPQKDIKFIRDLAHKIVLRLCGYTGPYYVAERFAVGELTA